MTTGAPNVRRYLLAKERLVAEVQWHPVWLLVPVLRVAAALFLIGLIASNVPAGSAFDSVLALALVLALGYLGWKFAEWWYERLIITDRRLLLVNGIIARRVAVMPLRKVTDMTFIQPPLGRLFEAYGWGTFVFESAGQDQALSRVRFIPRPDELYQRLSDEIFGEGGIYGRKAPKSAGLDE